MSVGGEKGAVQNPFLRYAQEAGWTYLSPEQALDLRRRGITSPVLDTVLVQQLQRLNAGIVDLPRAEELARRIARVRPNIEESAGMVRGRSADRSGPVLGSPRF